MEDLTGKQLGSYQIVAPLGEGGMAAVYKAYQPNMDRYVALKILPKQLAAQDPQFIARFNHEAKILAKLQHPHILPVHDFGEAEGYTYIVMPFVESGTLGDLLSGKPLAAPQVRSIISQVGDALDYAHSRGLVHRDVKPSNVLVDERGNCLLTDFGIAKIVEGTAKFTTTGGVIGTPAYMSPEQGRGEKVNAQSDIYSLGVVLYEMATGRVPFDAETPVAVIFKHVSDPLPPPRELNPNLPDSFERTILKSLAKNPKDRYQTARAMVEALNAEAGRPEKYGDASVTRGDSITLPHPPKPRATVPSSAIAVLVIAAAVLVLGVAGAAIALPRLAGNSTPTEEAVAQSLPTSAPTQGVTKAPTIMTPTGEVTQERAVTNTPPPPTSPNLTPAGVVLPTPTGKLLYSDDFEDGFSYGFDFYAGNWKVIDDNTGNKALEVRLSNDLSNASFGPHNFSDGIIEFRFRVTSGDGAMLLGFRNQAIDNNGDWTQYIVAYDTSSSSLSLAYQEKGGPWQPLEGVNGSGSIQNPVGDWVSLRVEAQGQNTTVFVNGVPSITAFDSRLDEQGGLYLQTGFGNLIVQFDDFKVWDIGPNTAPPTRTIAPTPQPTATSPAATESANWAVTLEYRFPAGFWTVGAHQYTLTAQCPGEDSGSVTHDFTVSDNFALAPGDIYLRWGGLKRQKIYGADPTIVDGINPSQSTVAVVTWDLITKSEADRIAAGCTGTVSWDGGAPHPLIAQTPFQH